MLQRLDAVQYEVKKGKQAFDALGKPDKLWVMANFLQAKAAGALIEERLSKLSTIPDPAAC